MSGLLMQRTGKYRRLAISAGVALVVGTLHVLVMVYLSKPWSLIGVVPGLIIMHLGIGIASTTTLTATMANVNSADQAIAMSISFLFRSLGGVVGISLGSATVQNCLRIFLAQGLSGGDYDVDEIIRRVRESLSYVDTLDPVTRAIVRGTYEKALLITFGISATMAACALVSTLFIPDKYLGDKARRERT